MITTYKVKVSVMVHNIMRTGGFRYPNLASGMVSRTSFAPKFKFGVQIVVNGLKFVSPSKYSIKQLSRLPVCECFNEYVYE